MRTERLVLFSVLLVELGIGLGVTAVLAQGPPARGATQLPTSCDDLAKRGSQLSGQVVVLNGRFIRAEGVVDEEASKTFSVYACVNSEGVARQPIVLFAVDGKTTKEENPEREPADQALWRIQGTVQGSVNVGSLSNQNLKEPVPLLINVQAKASKGK